MSSKNETKKTKKVKKISKNDLLLANNNKAAELREQLQVLKKERIEILNNN